MSSSRDATKATGGIQAEADPESYRSRSVAQAVSIHDLDLSQVPFGPEKKFYRSPSASGLIQGLNPSSLKITPSSVTRDDIESVQSAESNTSPSPTDLGTSSAAKCRRDAKMSTGSSSPSRSAQGSGTTIIHGSTGQSSAHQGSVPGQRPALPQGPKPAVKRLQRSSSYPGLCQEQKANLLQTTSVVQRSKQNQGDTQKKTATRGGRPKPTSIASGMVKRGSGPKLKAENTAKKSESTIRHQVLMTWKNYTRSWFPKLFERAHFMPHVFMHRVLRKTVTISGVQVDVPQPPENVQTKGSKATLLNCFVRDDRAQQHVLHCLQKIAEHPPGHHKEVMFVLSQLNFGDYLNDPCFAPAVSLFPRASDLKTEKLDRGDFDVLVIHRLCGLLVGEIKSFGENAVKLGWSEEDFDCELLKKFRPMFKLDKKSGTGQLEKARHVLQHLTKDQPRAPQIQATLILPYVSRAQLRRVLEKDMAVKQALCKDLGVPLSVDPVDMCLCSDQMSNSSTPWEFPTDIIEELDGWWRRCLTGKGPDSAMNDQVYEDLVARFAGPASVVKLFCHTEPRLKVMDVRTEDQAIAEVDRRLTKIALFPSQIDLLQQVVYLLFLTGPPGTGKSVMLVLKLLDWLGQGRHVYILSLDWRSHAASHSIAHQVRRTAQETLGKKDPGVVSRVHHHLFDRNKYHRHALIDEAANLLIMEAVGNDLHAVWDEADGKTLGALYTRLKSSTRNFTTMAIWAASISAEDVPEDFSVVTLTEPLRCPPSVAREVGQALRIQSGQVHGYTCPKAPPMLDGPPVIHLKHTQGEGGHAFPLIHDCEDCGMEIGRVLMETLKVGQERTVDSATTMEPPLRYRDVMVLTFFPLRDDKIDETGHVTAPADGLVRGVRRSGLPVVVLEEGDDDTVAMVATASGRDAVTMTSMRNVYGLERKIVVWVGRQIEGDDFGGRLHAMSRSTAQLIWIVR